MYMIGLVYRTCPFLASDIQARFCLAHLQGHQRLPSVAEMLSITEKDMQKRWDRFKKTRCAHMLDVFQVNTIKMRFLTILNEHIFLQAEYYKELAEIGSVTPIKPHVLPIYYEGQRYRIANFKGYREQTFNLIDDETYSTNINS